MFVLLLMKKAIPLGKKYWWFLTDEITANTLYIISLRCNIDIYIFKIIYVFFSSFPKRDVVKFLQISEPLKQFSRGMSPVLETGLLLFFNRRFEISSYHSSLSGFTSESRTGETPPTRRVAGNVGRVLRISTFAKLMLIRTKRNDQRFSMNAVKMPLKTYYENNRLTKLHSSH